MATVRMNESKGMIKTSQEQVLLAAKQADLEVIKKSGEGTYVGTILFTYSGGKVMAVDLQ